MINAQEFQYTFSVKVVIVVQASVERTAGKLDSSVAAAAGSLGTTVRIRTQTSVLNGLADRKSLATTAVIDHDDLNVLVRLAKRGGNSPTQ